MRAGRKIAGMPHMATPKKIGRPPGTRLGPGTSKQLAKREHLLYLADVSKEEVEAKPSRGEAWERRLEMELEFGEWVAEIVASTGLTIPQVLRIVVLNGWKTLSSTNLTSRWKSSANLSDDDTES